MRTFRITLSHGDEHITFDGVGTRSGSMFHVRRDAIEGLWSSPASKVSLTERETANGASPISDGETLYAARTVVIPFAIQSNYNHTDLIRARTLLGRLLGWHDVRMDINDDGDETVLNGYIEAKYSDIPYDHADTGTITLVCPDPRRVSKHESTISMNTSSSVLGGLSFGVPEYDKQWLGTPNASTSTLSQDGAVVATNLLTSPRTLDGYAVRYGAPKNVSLQTDDNGDTYLHIVGANSSACVIAVRGVDRPAISTACIQARSNVDIDRVHLNYNTHQLLTGDGMWHYMQVTSSVKPSWGPTGTVFGCEYFLKDGEYLDFKQPALFSPSDFQAMRDRGVTWFDGDSQSPQPNAGLAFPINFEQIGNAGNTGMIDNNGSYVSMPVITAHGWLNGGLTVHWTTSDGNEGDLSFTGGVGAVPVTINTDNHSAIMGGLDVSYQLGSRDWPRIPAGGSCSFALLASGGGWVTVQSHDTYM